MAEVIVLPDLAALAYKAAELTAKRLTDYSTQGSASWVLAGGSTPLKAYEEIVRNFKDQIDWAKIKVIMGDERCVPNDSLESNWNQIEPVLIKSLPFSEDNVLAPKFYMEPILAAKDYDEQLMRLAGSTSGVPRLDHVWLGMGEDGHTLSLFPGHVMPDSSNLVEAIEDSPNPPRERISLTLKALSNVGSCLVLVAGAAKATALKKALNGDTSLPVVNAINIVEANGGETTFLVDKASLEG